MCPLTSPEKQNLIVERSFITSPLGYVFSLLISKGLVAPCRYSEVGGGRGIREVLIGHLCHRDNEGVGTTIQKGLGSTQGWLKCPISIV